MEKKSNYVTIFGGSQPRTQDFAYQQAYHLGRLLGEHGYSVLTGGYIGTMEAVSRGTSDAGAHVIGVTCDEIERWRPVGPNQWVNEEIRFPTLRQRLFTLIDKCDAALVLPGGIGTLAEVATMWNQLQTNVISPRPLILIGAEWRDVFNTLFIILEDYIAETDQQYLTFAEDAESAMIVLNQMLDLRDA
jgi:uncharacterized protein (TIGR00730 family)